MCRVLCCVTGREAVVQYRTFILNRYNLAGPIIDAGTREKVSIVSTRAKADAELGKVLPMSGFVLESNGPQEGVTVTSSISSRSNNPRVHAGKMEGVEGDTPIDGASGATARDIQPAPGTMSTVQPAPSPKDDTPDAAFVLGLFVSNKSLVGLVTVENWGLWIRDTQTGIVVYRQYIAPGVVIRSETISPTPVSRMYVRSHHV